MAAAEVVYSEMEPRLRLLRRQANIAANALHAKSELRTALQWHYHVEWTRLLAERDQARLNVATGQASLEALRLRVQTAEAGQAEVQAQLEAARQVRATRRERLLEAEYSLKRINDSEASALDGLKLAEAEQAELERRLHALSETMLSEEVVDAIRSKLDHLRSRRDELIQVMETARSNAVNEQGNRDRLVRSRQELLKSANQLGAALSDLEERLRVVIWDSDANQARLQEITSGLPAFRADLELARAESLAAEERERRAEQCLVSARRSLELRAAEVAQARAKLSRAASKVAALGHALTESCARQTELVAERSHDDKAPSVIEYIRAPEDLSLALAAALDLLAESPASPNASARGPRVAEKPDRVWRDRIVERLREGRTDVLGWLDDLVDIDGAPEPVTSLVTATLVLGNSETLDEAWNLVAPLSALTVGHPPLRLVDINGAIRDARALDSAPAGARQSVRREFEIAKLDRQVTELAEQLVAAESEHSSFEVLHDDAIAALAAAEPALQAANVAASTERANVAAAANLVERVERDISNRESLAAELTESCQTLVAEVARLNDEIQSIKIGTVKANAEVGVVDEHLLQAAAALREAEDSIRERRSDLLLVERQLEMEEREHGRLIGLRAAHEREHHSIEDRQEVVEANRVGFLTGLLAAQGKRKGAEDELASARIEVEQAPPDQVATELGLAQRLQELRSEVETLVGESQHEQARLEYAEEALARLVSECLLDLAEYPSALHPEEPASELSEVDIRRLRVRAEQAEDLEPGVENEYRELVQRRDLLLERMEDLRSAAEQLEGMLRDADREARRRFRLTFSQVNDLFTGYFKQIFDGGSAELMCETLDDVESIEIIAQLPGKRARDLSGLSGGERTLVAGAFLFSPACGCPAAVLHFGRG